MCEVEISDTGMVEVVDDSQFNDMTYNNYEVGVDDYEDEEICETDDQALIMQSIDEGEFYGNQSCVLNKNMRKHSCLI